MSGRGRRAGVPRARLRAVGELSISNTHATDETIIELAACCPSLCVLNAQGCCAVGNAALTALRVAGDREVDI